MYEINIEKNFRNNDSGNSSELKFEKQQKHGEEMGGETDVSKVSNEINNLSLIHI